MRDPWLTGLPPGFSRNMWGAYPSVERDMLRRADGVITNTQRFQDCLRGAYPDREVDFVPNGIDSARIPSTSVTKLGGLSLIHAGTLYGNRDISPVLEALGRFLADRPEARGDVRLRLIGSMDQGHDLNVRRQIEAQDLTDIVEAPGALPMGQAIELVRRSHLALVLAQRQPMQVPAKLYECVAMGVPTLAITELTSATAGEARRTGASVCEPDDIKGIQRVIERLWDDPSPSPNVPLSEVFYDAVARPLDALLRSDIVRKNGGSALPRS